MLVFRAPLREQLFHGAGGQHLAGVRRNRATRQYGEIGKLRQRMFVCFCARLTRQKRGESGTVRKPKFHVQCALAQIGVNQQNAGGPLSKGNREVSGTG